MAGLQQGNNWAKSIDLANNSAHAEYYQYRTDSDKDRQDRKRASCIDSRNNLAKKQEKRKLEVANTIRREGGVGELAQLRVVLCV